MIKSKKTKSKITVKSNNSQKLFISEAQNNTVKNNQQEQLFTNTNTIVKNYNKPEFKETVEKILKENASQIKYEFYDNYLSNNQKSYFEKPIGLFDPLGENINPYTMQPYEPIYADVFDFYKSGPLKDKQFNKIYPNTAVIWSSLPMYKKLPELIKTIRENQVTLLVSGTGSGKTVLTPRAVMQALNFQKKAIITIPKKVICRNAAKFEAQMASVPLGDEVGYYYRGDKVISDKTKLFFTTTGSLISKITRADPYLEDYDCVIVDEAHECSVETDELLYFLKKALIKRKDLKLVIMSATIDLSTFRNYFPNGNSSNNSLENISKAKFKFGEIDVGGDPPKFKIDIHYSQSPINIMDWEKKAAEKVIELLTTTEVGDIMVFITSPPDGKKICDEVMRGIKDRKDVHPFCAHLSGSSPDDERNYALGSRNLSLHPNYDETNPWSRKIVLSTNVAESSLTVPSIVYVIDSGYQYEESFDAFTNARSLVKTRISKAQAIQRKGRAGRTMDGVCFRLYTEEEYNKFNEYPIPDIRKQDLTPYTLDLMLLPYVTNIGDLKKKVFDELIEKPKPEFIKSAIDILNALGAIDSDKDEGKITEIGRALSEFRAISIQSAKAILASYYLGCKHDVMTILTLFMKVDGKIKEIYGREPNRKGMNNFEYSVAMKEYEKKTKQWNSEYGDFITLWNIYQAYREYIYTEPRKTPDEARTWLKENALNVGRFMRKDEIDIIASDVQKLNRTLMDIVQPPELKKKYFNELKKQDPTVTLTEIKNELKEKKMKSVGFDPEQKDDLKEEVISVKDTETIKKGKKKIVKMNDITMMGGYEAKPYEIMLIKDLKKMDDKLDNIMMSLAYGYLTNMAKNINSSRMIYKACFPQVKVDCQFARDTTLSTKRAPAMVLYGEMMRLRLDAKMLKMNGVNRIPTVVMDQMKELYPELMKQYSKVEKNKYNDYSSKKSYKGDRKGERKGSRKQGKKKYRR